MIYIHLFGKLRNLTPFPKATDDSVIEIPWKEDMNILVILNYLHLGLSDVGEIFVNHTCITDFQKLIPDDARVAIFAEGMHLLCGGQHLKGHGFIQQTHSPMSYWNEPFRSEKENE